MCKFYVGQKVVYIGKDLKFDPNPGKTVHTIQATRKASCKCPGIEIHVGKVSHADYFKCSDCRLIWESDGVFWKHSESFRPLIEDYTEEEIEAVNIDELTQQIPQPA